MSCLENGIDRKQRPNAQRPLRPQEFKLTRTEATETEGVT